MKAKKAVNFLLLNLLAMTVIFSLGALSAEEKSDKLEEEMGIPQKKEFKWEKIIEESGITVYRREDPNSNMFEFKGQGIIDAPIPKILALLQDISLMPEWVDGCKDAKLLYKNYNSKSFDMKINEFTTILYGHNKVPWPLNDRDYVLKGKIAYSAKNDVAYINLLNTTHKDMPPKSGLVRMNFMKTRITLAPRNNDKSTWMQLYVHLDPGGYIPAWAVNFVTKSVPLKSLKKLRKLAAGEKYDKEMEDLVWYHVKKIRGNKENADEKTETTAENKDPKDKDKDKDKKKKKKKKKKGS